MRITLFCTLLAIGLWGCSTSGKGSTDFDDTHTSPRVVGGIDALYDQFRTPDQHRDSGDSGRVLIRFVISPDSTVAKHELLQLGSHGLNQDVVNAIYAVDWVPGTKQGEPVRVQMTIPFVFPSAPSDISMPEPMNTTPRSP